MAHHIYTYINPSSKRDIAEACRILENGGLIAYPTDVNWALGCDAAQVKALDKVRRIKSYHPKEQPFSLLCSSIAMIAEYGYIEQPAYRLLKRILPGPYTVLLRRIKNLVRQLHDKRPVVGVRLPDAPLLLDLVNAFGRPLATTSMPVHPSTGMPLRFGYEIAEVFGHELELVLDLGEELAPRETSIIDLSSEEGYVLLREGEGDSALLASFGVTPAS